MSVEIRRLLATSLALLGLLAAVDVAASRLVRRAGRSNPDARGSPVVLIGDSVLYSDFIDVPSQSLSNRLEARLKVPVFPAAVTGAGPQEMLSMAARVARLWPAGTVALVGIHPVRIFEDADAGPRARKPGTPKPPPGAIDAFESRLADLVSSRSFLVRDREAILWFLDARLRSGRRSIVAERRDRRWDADDGSALRRFRELERALADGGSSRRVPFTWIEEIGRALGAARIRPVFVLTPLNLAMVRRYSSPGVPVERLLSASRDRLARRLEADGHEYIDLFDCLGSDSFADAVHSNAKGNDELAAAVAGWLTAHPRTAPPAEPAGR